MNTMIGSEIFQGHFKGRRALVTGGASGIGYGIGQAFAEAGASVLLVDRSPQVSEAAANLRAAGFDVDHAIADVTDEAQVKAAFAKTVELWGGLDILVNNAGIITIANLEDLSLDEFNKVLAVNTTAVFLCCREAAPLLKASDHGVILNASSGQGRQGFIFTPHYAASKFGVIGLTQSLAKELAPSGVRVNSYCPGIVKTEMWEYNDREWGSRLGNYKPGELIQEWIDGIPLKRPAEATDVANLLLFLASDAGSYITGQAINIDGGMFMN
ncbi:SDR family NAD(P)-dependent oxidoreductase [Arthrobacter sp. ISL-5]|uniref:SDR family NAD(P)-dependent oxidoreductase n=1 Tax=Arthrobacter sp. ISL-5 TaxID=2819111 RepID=UPI001BEB372D|nr:SDR family NAD(P)-dependent oxidoreductase [Arthrobacter sp. ISL-5]MBT2552532.1 SDR family oxidoreductase [Arthrobacter sp. ISL-5]